MKKGLLTALISGVTIAFAATALYAGSPDVIKMQSDYKHKKAIVDFSHKKHVEEYKAECGECHHDKDGKALNDLTADSKVQKCIECHAKPGKAGKDAKTPKEKMEYHANALHKNCISCHKTKKAGPTKCKECHPKKAKK